MARGKFDRQACEEVATTGSVSANRMRKTKTSLYKKLVAEFLEVWTEDVGLFDTFGEAGKKAIRANAQMEDHCVVVGCVGGPSGPQEVARFVWEVGAGREGVGRIARVRGL